MSGNAKFKEPLTSHLLLFVRMIMAGFLVLHSYGQLMAFWQAAQIIGADAFPALLINAALPLTFFVGAVTLAIGLGTRLAAIAMIVLLAGTSLSALVMSGSFGGGALNAWERLTVIFALVQLVMFGAGRWSVDAVIAARLAARTAQ